MYTLFYAQGTCSAATQVVLRELGQEVKLIDAKQHNHFTDINPVGAVPALIDGNQTLTEGAAIILHLLNKHENSLFPGANRQQSVEDIMFANATMHPAYGRLFFIAQHVTDEKAKQEALNAAANIINKLWQVVENKLSNKPFLGGDTPSAADIMLTVYSRWSAYFDVNIIIGEKATAMLNAVKVMPNFIKTDEAEQAISAQ